MYDNIAGDSCDLSWALELSRALAPAAEDPAMATVCFEYLYAVASGVSDVHRSPLVHGNIQWTVEVSAADE
jgi:hypothetical protein